MTLRFWKEPPPPQTVASWADLAVILTCVGAIVAVLVWGDIK